MVDSDLYNSTHSWTFCSGHGAWGCFQHRFVDLSCVALRHTLLRQHWRCGCRPSRAGDMHCSSDIVW